ncbi:MAG TPA: hypothetical protein VF384_03395 [Planctomycetota bacterium]
MPPTSRSHARGPRSAVAAVGRLRLIGYRFFGQYAVLDLPANPFGFTTSNYLNVLTGN